MTPDATTWLRRVSQNPDKYGTTPDRVRHVERRVNALLACDDAARIKREQRQIEGDAE